MPTNTAELPVRGHRPDGCGPLRRQTVTLGGLYSFRLPSFIQGCPQNYIASSWGLDTIQFCVSCVQHPSSSAPLVCFSFLCLFPPMSMSSSAAKRLRDYCLMLSTSVPLLMRMLSIWILSLWLDEIQVSLCISLCAKRVSKMFKFQKSISHSPLSFVVPHPC